MSLQFEDIKIPLAEQFRSTNRRYYSKGSVRVSPSECILPVRYKQFADRIKNFEVREDDVWILTYPKCGTTWTQEMVWLLINNMDFKRATQEELPLRSPFLEYVCFPIPEEEKAIGLNCIDTIAQAENSASPRCIKCHLPKDLLPDQLWTKKPKIVNVTRGVKDVLVSYYNHICLMSGYTGSLDDFAEAFMSETVVYWDPFWKHNLDFWKMRNEENILINSFEEMKKLEYGSSVRDPHQDYLIRELDKIQRKAARFVLDDFRQKSSVTKMLQTLGWEELGEGRRAARLNGMFRADLRGTIRKTAKFLGKEYSEEQILALAKHLDFNNMKDNPMVNFEERKKILNEKFCNDATFMRRGEVGSGRQELSPELAARVDKWSKERIQGSGYPFVG